MRTHHTANFSPTLQGSSQTQQSSTQLCDNVHRLPPACGLQAMRNHLCLSIETSKRAVILKESGLAMTEIRNRLFEEQIHVSRVALYKLWRRYKKTGSIANTPRAQPVKRLGWVQCLAIDEAMAENDELTSRQLRGMLDQCWPWIEVSLSTIKQAWKELGCKPPSRIVQYLLAVMLVKMTTYIAPCGEIPSHTCTFIWGLAWGLSFLGSLALLKHRCPWLSNCAEHSSVHTTSATIVPCSPASPYTNEHAFLYWLHGLAGSTLVLWQSCHFSELCFQTTTASSKTMIPNIAVGSKISW